MDEKSTWDFVFELKIQIISSLRNTIIKNIKIMKRMLFILIALFTTSLISIEDVQAQEKKKKDNQKTMKAWVSMDCENCKAKIEKNIAFEKGVKSLEVDLKTKTVTIDYRTDKTNPQKLEKAIEKLGYTAEIIEEEKEKEQKTK